MFLFHKYILSCGVSCNHLKWCFFYTFSYSFCMPNCHLFFISSSYLYDFLIQKDAGFWGHGFSFQGSRCLRQQYCAGKRWNGWFFAIRYKGSVSLWKCFANRINDQGISNHSFYAFFFISSSHVYLFWSLPGSSCLETSVTLVHLPFFFNKIFGSVRIHGAKCGSTLVVL